jgi:hypothetical protein
MDFKAYLASDSEESDEGEEDRAAKYRALLMGGEDGEEGSDSDEEGGRGKKGKKKVGRDDEAEDDVDMEITFTPGLSEAVAEQLNKKKEMEVCIETTVFLF